MGIVKVAMLGLGGVFLAVLLKQQKQDYALYIGLGCAVCILFFAVDRLSVVMGSVKQLQSLMTVDSSYVKALIKMIGITYVAEFAASLCQDAGYSSIGTQIEMFGKLSIIALSMPILMVLIQTLEGFLT
ncbi:MAG: stage III sporulation protein AD [Eubacterium sp.]|nr:stage III sporulation protein AD [Eubacterium sp.]